MGIGIFQQPVQLLPGVGLLAATLLFDQQLFDNLPGASGNKAVGSHIVIGIFNTVADGVAGLGDHPMEQAPWPGAKPTVHSCCGHRRIHRTP